MQKIKEKLLKYISYLVLRYVLGIPVDYKTMKKIVAVILIIFFTAFVSYPFVIFAANTHSIDIESTDDPLKYLTAGASADFAFGGDFTVYAWVNAESFTATYTTIFARGDRTDGIAYWFEISAAQQPALWYYSGANYTYVRTDTAWDNTYLGVWHHIAITCDVSVPSCLIYVDGSSVAATTQFTGATAVDDTGNLTIGAIPDSGTYGSPFDGLIDEATIFSDIRTAEEILADYNTQRAGNEGNIVANYMFDGSSLEDKGTGTDPAGAVADDLTNNNSVVFSTSVPFGGEVAGPPKKKSKIIFFD